MAVSLSVVLIGGELRQPYVLDTRAMAWACLEVASPAASPAASPGLAAGLGRLNHACLQVGRRVLIHGGIDPMSEVALDDTLELSGGLSAALVSEAAVTYGSVKMSGRKPTARSQHCVARAGRHVVLVGGLGGRHGLAVAEEEAAETEQREREEAEIAVEVGQALKGIRDTLKGEAARAKQDQRRERAEEKKAAEAAAAAVAAETAAAAAAARDALLQKRGEEALRKVWAVG